MFFPWLIGQFFESTGPSIMIIVILAAFGASLILMGGTMLYLPRHEQLRSQAE
jgi:hypothetical protein